MKIARSIVIALLASTTLAATPSWDLADAPRAADQDFRAGHVQFYWCGTIGVHAPGVPMSLALRYPQLDGGKGCTVWDPPLRERQAEYSARYNKHMLALLEHHR
jgi:hypothetical protein